MRRLPLRSPPRMRGKAKNRCRSCPLTRITPACAGKRSSHAPRACMYRDHPRVCGEKPVTLTSNGHIQGSPPRMRGKVAGVCACNVVQGITPAYAGKSKVFKNLIPTYEDHPRVCGEKCAFSFWSLFLLGSPPRMRGKGRCHHPVIFVDRITPAYAGKSLVIFTVVSFPQDHPRVCGEKKRLASCAQQAEGSPPRVRGKAIRIIRLSKRTGITPACAGKSSELTQRSGTNGDHPRVCGEKHKLTHDPVREGGSPPRVRGKVHLLTRFTPICRITPACAGKSNARPSPCGAGRDHPRVCGEKSTQPVHRDIIVGSPPRVRGKDLCDVVLRQQAGITPACAGKRLKRSHSIGHFSCILCLFHSVLHRASVSGGSRAGPCAPPCLPAQNAVPV